MRACRLGPASWPRCLPPAPWLQLPCTAHDACIVLWSTWSECCVIHAACPASPGATRSPRRQPGSLWVYVGSCSACACACAFCIVDFPCGIRVRVKLLANFDEELIAGSRRFGDRVDQSATYCRCTTACPTSTRSTRLTTRCAAVHVHQSCGARDHNVLDRIHPTF